MSRELATEPTLAEWESTRAEFDAKGMHLAKVHMIDPPAVQYTVAPFKGGKRHLCTWQEVEATLASLYGQRLNVGIRF